MSDEYTPREHGLQGGHMWAERFAGTAEELQRIAGGDIPEGLRVSVEAAIVSGWRTWREVRDEDLAEFWEGFRDGVRAWIVEVRHGMSPN